MTTETHIAIGTNPDTLKPYSVIIVDDGAIDRSLLRRFLQSEKFEILRESKDAEDVLYYLANSIHKPDVLCLDLYLPGKSGIDVIKEVNHSCLLKKTI